MVAALTRYEADDAASAEARKVDEAEIIYNAPIAVRACDNHATTLIISPPRSGCSPDAAPPNCCGVTRHQSGGGQ